MKIYRTVRLNQFQQFDNVTNFPKLLVAFHSEEEADFDEVNNRISPEPHICSTAGCSLQSEGLSFFGSLQWHTLTNSLNNITVYDLISLNAGEYSLHIPLTEENLKNAERIVAATKKRIKKERLGKKLMAYICYEYEFTSNPDWILQPDQNMCNDGPDYHCTLSPTRTLPCEFTKIKDEMYAYFPELLRSGWSAHCIKLIAESEPPSLESSFDRELWSSCRVIFKYMDYVHDFDTATILSNVLQIARENSYSSVIFLQNTEIQARKITKALLLLMEEIENYSDTQSLSWLLRIVQKFSSLKNSQKVTFGMFGEEITDEDQDSTRTD